MKSSSKVSPHPPLHERCHHLSPSGRRCSQPACSSHPTLCFTHVPEPTPPPSPDLAVAAELSQAAGSLDSPEDVCRLLSKTVLAFIDGRLPLKKAGMIGFLGQILLRTHREIAFHETARRKRPLQYMLRPEYMMDDVPRPLRDPIIHDLPEPLRPPYDEDPPTTVDAAPATELQPVDTSLATPIVATAPSEPIETPSPTPPPAPVEPPKFLDLSRFYPNDPTLDPRFNAYNPIPFIPAERTDEPVYPRRNPSMLRKFRGRPFAHRRHP